MSAPRASVDTEQLTTINLWELRRGARVVINHDSGSLIITRGKYNRVHLEVVWMQANYLQALYPESAAGYHATLHPEDRSMSVVTLGRRTQLHTHETATWLCVWPTAIRRLP